MDERTLRVSSLFPLHFPIDLYERERQYLSGGGWLGGHVLRLPRVEARDW